MAVSDLGKLTQKKFDTQLEALIKAKKIRADNECLVAARRVLVHGEALAETAIKLGLDITYLSRVCWRVHNAKVCECCDQLIQNK